MALQYPRQYNTGGSITTCWNPETELCGGVTPQELRVTHSDSQGGRRQINSLTSLSSLPLWVRLKAGEGQGAGIL